MNLKNRLKIGLLLIGVSILSYSCVKDDDFQEINSVTQTKPSLTTTKIYFDEIKANKTVFSKISKVKAKFQALSKTKSNNRTISNDDSGLTINTNFANFVEYKSGYHSYTFMVSNTQEGEGLKNVLLSLQQDGTYKEYLVSYNFDANDLYNLENGLEIDFTNKVNFSELATDFSNQLFQRVIYQDGCVTITATENPCTNGGDHSYPTTCNSGENPDNYAQPDTYYISDTCGDGPNSGGSTDSWFPGGDTSGGHGSGGPNSTPTYCSPRNCQEVPDDPLSANDCENIRQELIMITNNTTVKNHIDGLKNGIFSSLSNNYKEDGVRFAKIGPNQFTPRYPSEKLNNGLDYSPNYQNNETLSIHIHQQEYFDVTISPNPFFNAPVPSDQDIIESLENINYINNTNPSLASEVTQIVMTEAGIFAIVVDTQSALNALNALQDEDVLNKFKKKYKRKVLGKWNKINQNAGEECDSDCLNETVNNYKDFVKNTKIGGSTLNAKVLQAVLDQNNEITDWICE